jgi:hypothetical protein
MMRHGARIGSAVGRVRLAVLFHETSKLKNVSKCFCFVSFHRSRPLHLGEQRDVDGKPAA